MIQLDRIRKQHVSIMRHKKWVGVSGILACGEVTITEEIPTACTDGWNVKYNPDFVDSLDDAELRFLILHENFGHKAHQHLSVWRSLHIENAMLANQAADYFVNTSLHYADDGEGFITMPKMGIPPEEKYRGWSVKQIFDDLKQQGEDDDGQGDAGDMDSHDWDGAKDVSDKKAESRAKEIDRAMRQGESLRKKMGKGSGNDNGVFGNALSAKVDWREVLREFINSTCAGKDESTWSKPNRRFLSEDIYMPSLQSIQAGELVIGFDTSGSCFGGAEMTRFVSEIAGIVDMVKPEKLHIIYCDTDVSGHQVFEDGQFAVHNMKPTGGGGTDLMQLFKYVESKQIVPAACVFFTDGYTDYDASGPSYPVLWAMSTKVRAPWGINVSVEV